MQLEDNGPYTHRGGMDNQPLQIEYFQDYGNYPPVNGFLPEREKDEYDIDHVEKYNELFPATLWPTLSLPVIPPLRDLLQPDENHNPRLAFYNKFKRETDEYDIDYVKKYNEDLDSTLIFSGMFSAVTPAFIGIVPMPQLGLDWESPALFPTLSQSDIPPVQETPPRKIFTALRLTYASLLIPLFALLPLACGLSKYAFIITTPDAGLFTSLNFFGTVFYFITVGAVSYRCLLWTPPPAVPCGPTKETCAILRSTTLGRPWVLLSTLWRIMKSSAVSADVTQLAWNEILEDLRTPREDDPSSQEPTSETQQSPDCSFKALKRILSYRRRRELLYLLQSGEALAVINVLEQGLRDDSPLCVHDKRRFSIVLRKMCHEHGLLPSSHIITDELKWTGKFPAGRGGFADVWCGIHRDSQVAIKAIRTHAGMDITNLEKKLCREVVTWKQFKHPNLLPFVGTKKVSQTLMIVSEWMEHGTIMEFISAHPESNRLKLLADVARGLKYLHDWPSVHADLKSSNILIDSDYSARIADFGLATILDHSNLVLAGAPKNRAGTFQWMAPELFTRDCRPTKESDIYAFGVVAYEIFTHERPFSHVSPCVAPMLILAGERPLRPTNKGILGLSEGTWNMINRCWDRVPSDRPPIANLFTHFEISWREWISPTPEVVAELKFGCPTDQTERKSADAMSVGGVGIPR